MKTVEDYVEIRRAYFVEGKSIRQIHRELGVARETVRKALIHPEPEPYQLSEEHPAPVFGEYRARIEELIKERNTLPRKQRHTGKKIYQKLQVGGVSREPGTCSKLCQSTAPGPEEQNSLYSLRIR
jgi:transposase